MGIRLISSSATALAAVVVAGAWLPAVASARSALYLLPSLALTEVYDDNLFFVPDDHQEDRFLRLRPAVRLGYRTLPTDLDLTYSQDLERYNQYQDLDTNQARRDLSLDWSFRPNRLLTLHTAADYIKTRSPGELAALTGVQFGRVFAERRYFSPSLEYAYDNLTTANARYEYSRDKITNGIGSDTNTVDLGVNRRLSPYDTADIRYRFDRFHFDSGQSVNVHTLLFGTDYQFTPRLAVTALAGPRFTGNDSTDASVSAQLRYRIERGDLSLDYQRSQTTILGVGAAVDSETLGATLTLMPVKDVELRAVPNYSNSTNAGLRTEVYRFLLEAGWQATTYLTVVGSYEFTAQHGSLLSSGANETTHNLIMIGVVVASPQRVERGGSRRRIYLPSTLGGEPAPIPGQLGDSSSLEEE
jgi:hypothetical protein